MREAQLANRRATRLRRLIIIGSAALAAVLVIVMVVVVTLQSNGTAGAPPSATTSASGTTSATATASASASGSEVVAPPHATSNNDGIIHTSNPGKPVVQLYFDYQCGPCQQFDASFGTALDLLAQTHEIELVHHALVFIDQNNTDGPSHKAAMAAACSDVVGAYIPYNTAIWNASTQGKYTDDLFLKELPPKAGITGDALATFTSCYTSKAMLPFFNGVGAAGLKAGLTETPQLVVNGKMLPNSTFTGKSGNDLKQIIEDAAKG
ncbi:MAG: thioredoxin domain-containing protein [Actinobacteria bacterium]|nr:thioredoxin domain-containing protein [Actinomycetota bacterium]